MIKCPNESEQGEKGLVLVPSPRLHSIAAGQSLWKELEAASHIHSSEGREGLLSATFSKKSHDSNSAVGVPSVSPR